MRKSTFLIDTVALTPHFQRSVNVAIDLDKEDVLNGYVLQPTAKAVLENLANSISVSKQSAFTWTGPYGSGKSSLAILLASLLSSNTRLKRQAQSILSLENNSEIFKVSSKKWVVLPISGERTSIIDLLYEAAPKYLPSYPKKPGRRSEKIIENLDEYAKSKGCKILLVIDEMGKILEHMARNDEDIHFFQNLAERTRDHQRIITIGILHQNFEQYGNRLSKELRDEWMKVQGRYVDLPLVTTNDETVTLVSRAVRANYPHEESKHLARVIYENIKKRRANISSSFQETLDKCWPLHPIVAAVIGPASRKRYGQNERSLFGFLSSVEAKGFREFLEHTKASSDACYNPANYWDYLDLNLSAAIQGSSDSRTWSLITAALERSNRFSQKHQELVKSIAILELFKDSSGLYATTEVLETLNIAPRGELLKLLEALTQASIIVFRKHIDCWALYAGSDFDIETSLEEAKSELGDPSAEILAKLIDPAPVIAKEHYWESGCLRWFTKQILSISGLKTRQGIKIDEGSGGAFILVLPDDEIGVKDFQSALIAESKSISVEATFSHVGIVLGAVKQGDALKILREAQELAGLQLLLETSPELEGDPIARQEIRGRIESIQILLEGHIESAMLDASWTYAGEPPRKFDRKVGLGIIASDVASRIYRNCPKFDNEILNRQAISSSASKARRELLYAMLNSSHEENLGYQGFSADSGLYHSILKEHRLHVKKGDTFQFVCDSSRADNLSKLWRKTEAFIETAQDGRSLEDIYQLWQSPPYGLRRGLMPVLIFTFYLANREKYAVYSESAFITKITELYVDELLRFPEQFTIKAIRLTQDQESFLAGLAKNLASGQKPLFNDTPLEVARSLVARIIRLPSWAKRTGEISAETSKIRATLLAASDPHALLFHDLPKVLGTNDAGKLISALTEALQELEKVLPERLQKFVELLAATLDPADCDLKAIRTRAMRIANQSGDPDIDGFVSTLAQIDKSYDKGIKLLSAAARKQPSELTDLDIRSAENQLISWCIEFKKLELITTVKSRDSGRYILNLAFGLSGDPQDSVVQFEISDTEAKIAENSAKEVLDLLKALDNDTKLATLIHTSKLLLGAEK